MSTKSQLNYFLLVFSLVAMGCRSTTNEKTGGSQDKDKLFKKWVKDTTATIKLNPDSLSNGLINSKIVVNKDSLSLSDLKTYEFDSRNKIQNPVISNVILLLKEYDELPRNRYKLSFETEMYFYPSVTDNLKHDFSYELKSILLKTTDLKIEYKYISGRLSGKRVFKSTETRDSTTYDLYDFVWDGNKLIKRKI